MIAAEILIVMTELIQLVNSEQSFQSKTFQISALKMPLTPSMLLELGAATAWTFYYILEAGVKLFIPSKMFHKVLTSFFKQTMFFLICW